MRRWKVPRPTFGVALMALGCGFGDGDPDQRARIGIVDIEPKLQAPGVYEFHLWTDGDMCYCAAEICGPPDAGVADWMACGVAGAGGALQEPPQLRCNDIPGVLAYCDCNHGQLSLRTDSQPRAITGLYVGYTVASGRLRVARACEVLFDGEIALRDHYALVQIQ